MEVSRAIIIFLLITILGFVFGVYARYKKRDNELNARQKNEIKNRQMNP